MKLLLVALALLTLPFSTYSADVALPDEVSLSVGESLLLVADLRRAALGSGKVVSIAVPERGQLLLFGEAAGRTTAQLWLRDGSRHVLQVTVTEQDLAARLAQIRGLLSGVENVGARISGGYVLLEGARASADDLARAAEVAALFPGQVLNFVGRSGWESMVQMQVRLIEVRRDQLRQLGLRWDSDAAGPAVSVAAGGAAGAPGAHVAIATLLQSRLELLQQRGLAYTVAEPTLSCRSGGMARFVSGGEIPIPITDGLGSTDVQYKEYGVILEIRPRADRSGAIYADIDIEMSQMDASVRVGDFPGFVKRRASTAFNAQAGETIAIAGLVSRERSRDRSGIPGLASIPGIGALFRTSRRLDRETELVVLITPRSFDAGVRLESAASTDQHALLDRARDLDESGRQP
ncbi:MAG: pilus assembly protein N-terminal domain-containing protein [Steroidobacteraceae bacterium]